MKVHTMQKISADFTVKEMATTFQSIFRCFLQAPVNIFRNQAKYDSKGHVLFLVIQPFNPTKLFSIGWLVCLGLMAL